MSMDDFDITPIGVTNWRNQNKPFGIKDKDRLGHIYVIGKTGMGKSTLLMTMAKSDIVKGKGCGIIDPHGDVARNLLKCIPDERKDDLIYFDPVNNPIAFNPLHGVHPGYHHIVVSGLISTFKKIWWDSWGPRLEYILRYSLLTLLQYPRATLLHIQPLLTDTEFRKEVLRYVKEQHILNFWYKEFDKYSPALKAESISPILNKIGLFVSSKPVRNIFNHETSSFRISQVLEQSKIFIANLSKGQLGEDASTLIGSILVNVIQLAALYRSKMPENKRIPFYLYIDEAHSFISLSIAEILSESRKYGLSLFLAHQYINQLKDEIRSAIFGNVGTVICFRVGAEDADFLEKEFYPTFSKQDLINLPKHILYLKLLIDGAASNPFSGKLIKAQLW